MLEDIALCLHLVSIICFIMFILSWIFYFSLIIGISFVIGLIVTLFLMDIHHA